MQVPPLVDSETYALARELRVRRNPTAASGRASAKPHLLTGLLRCGQCGASYQLETSGKRVDGCTYRYCYYNCRSYCRSGKSVCTGHRVDTATLDAAVLRFVTDAVCREDRARYLRRALGDRGVHLEDDVVARAWRGAILEDPHIGRAYLVRLVDRVEVHGERIVVVARSLPEHGEDDAVGESRNAGRAVDNRALSANAK